MNAVAKRKKSDAKCRKAGILHVPKCSVMQEFFVILQFKRICKILRTNSVKNREKTKETEKASTRLKVLEQEDVICEIDDDEEVVSNTKDSENER